MAKNLHQMGFVSCSADPDVWMKPATKADSTESSQYVICYVDDVAAAMDHRRSSWVS